MEIVRDVYNGLLDLVYPPFCLVCEEVGDEYLCAKCIEKIDIIEPPYCRQCGIPGEALYCPECKEREFHFESARSAGTFDGTLREAIHRLKYDPHIMLAEPLGELMARCFPNTRLAGKVDLIIPIPIHRSRVVKRGFNQATELARVMGKRIGLPIKTSVLYKRKRTRPQVGLPREERAANMAGAFAARNPERIGGRRVLLVDDVFTTGSTVNEAARTLKAAGASSVHAYTLARGV